MKLLVIIVLMFMLVAPQVSATTQLNIYIDNIGDSLFLGTTDENITLPEGVSLRDGRISGYTSNLTVKSGETWTFTYALARAELQVTLPEGAVIKSVSPSEISLDGGQISLYARNSVRATYVIERVDENSNSVLIWILIILVVLVGVVYVWNFLKGYLKGLVSRSIKKRETRRASRENKSTSQIQHLLHERENTILAKLRETGKTKMSYLRKACDMPKASFSRHVHELVKKKLLVLSGEGKNKFVELA